RRIQRPGLNAFDLRLDLLADELRSLGDHDVVAVQLRDRSLRVEQVDFNRLQLDARALLHRAVRRNGLELALRRDEAMVEMDVRLLLEEEATLRGRLDLAETRSTRPRDEGGDPVVELDPERLHARTARELAQPALGVDRRRLLGDDDAVAAARRTLTREDLARPLGDVLPRHLDQAERRNLDDIRLRAVAFELGAQRFLDCVAGLRVRHVDEVDDDDA